jgi:hypothetical protein
VLDERDAGADAVHERLAALVAFENVAVNRGEQLVVNFKDGVEVTLTPPPETSFYVNGKKAKVAELERGSDLNFYIAETASRRSSRRPNLSPRD